MVKASKKKVNRDIWMYLKVFAVFLALCLLIALVCFQYYQELYSTIKDESTGYLQEISSRIGDNIDRIISDNFAALYTMASTVEVMGYSLESNLSSVFKKSQQQWSYQTIIMIDEDGQSYDMDTNQTFMMLDDTVRESIISGNKSMSTTQVINNQEYILFSVPLKGVSFRGKDIVALAASFDPASFDKVLSMESFDKQAYSQIVTKTGTAITRPSTPYTIKAGYNVFASLETAKMDRESSLEAMKKNITAGRSGVIGFTPEDSMERYMVYNPVVSNEWYLLTFVPMQVVTDKSDTLLKTTMVVCGLITIAFASLSAILVYIFNKNKRHLERIAYIDEVTGGNSIQRFYELAGKTLHSYSSKQFVIVYTNMAKFKVMNEELGQQNCDIVLRMFYELIASFMMEDEFIARISADNFCVFMEFKSEEDLLKRFSDWRTRASSTVTLNNVSWSEPKVEMGIYVIVDKTMPIPQMIDRAKLSLKDSLTSIDSKLSYSFYDDDIRRKIFREKQLEDKMEIALKGREFKVHLQPKYSINKERIGGAEALVRWINGTEGMIYPNEFIPLFEKNGFIVQIDLWVFEEVCSLIRSWLDRGIEPVKVSVNCSRVHFKNPKFLDAYTNIIDKYGIKRSYIEIEITESVVFENSDVLIKIIHQIKNSGFGCSMDDFGSGYSSLNLIQAIPVDTLKLDKSFFMTGEDGFDRGEAVVKNIVSMARALSMETVAEGVEYSDQMEMLKHAGCNYIQGYAYAKPMSIEAFEEFAFGIKKES